MKKSEITIIDYGMGNIWSVANAFKYLDCNVLISSDTKIIEKAQALVLPGVGSFRKAMAALKALSLEEVILESALVRKNKLLGICLGMQLMGQESTEDGETKGLNLIPAKVNKFTQEEVGALKIPHIGFNQVKIPSNSTLFRDIADNQDFYFVHSFKMLPISLEGRTSLCNYGIDFLAAYENDNLFATQFHPEKSQANGLKLLLNFLNA
jgi:glutamine amidotransferase